MRRLLSGIRKTTQPLSHEDSMVRTRINVVALIAITSGVCVLAGPARAADAPLAEKYLVNGQLADGAKALQARLAADPKDDQARFGLGVVQFLQTFEHVGGSLYKYGLRTEKSFLQPPPEVKEFLPQNPKPETMTYPALRQIAQIFVNDLAKVEQTLSAVKDPAVKLPLHVGQIKIDPWGQGKPISAAFLFERVGDADNGPVEKGHLAEHVASLVVGFDRADVEWLRGYCHFLAAAGELWLSIDGQHAFDCTAHLFFEKVETPHKFLLEDRTALDDDVLEKVPAIIDAVSFIHQSTRVTIKEPERTAAALAHLEAGIVRAKAMWEFALAEADDDNEWIPNPKQTGVMGVPVTQKMIDTWLETLNEAEQVLKGKALVPLWRGKEERGVNVRRAFLESRTIDPIEWIQGTAATPYLEKGPLTKFATSDLGTRLNEAFGGPFRIAAFGFWFN